MSLSRIALEALRAAQTAFTESEADVFEDALARGLEAVDREGRLVGAFAAAELERLRERVAELEKANAGLDDLRIRALDNNTELRAQLESARVDGQRLIRAEQRTAELEAVLGTHRRDDQAKIERMQARVDEVERAYTFDTAELKQKLDAALKRVAELEAAQGTVFRASHDSIVMGHYTTREAAQAHCEAKVQQEEPAGSIRHLSWSADDIGDDAEYELHITPAETGELIRGTGYVVTPVEVASEYDEGADE